METLPKAVLSLAEIREKFCVPVKTDVFPLQPQASGAHVPSLAGIPRGALSEVTGQGKTEWISEFLAGQTDVWTAWIETGLTVFPVALAQRRVNLERLFFVDLSSDVKAGGEMEWCALQILASRLFPIVILSGDRLGPFSDRGLRRMEVAARQARAALVMVSETPSEVAWPFALRVKLERGHAVPRVVRVTKSRVRA